MEQNQSNSSDRNDQTNQPRSNSQNESLNTASGLRDQSAQQSDASGSGRSYDYGSEGSTEEELNQQQGRNSNQQSVSNPVNTPGSTSSATAGAGHNDSRAGSGSGATTKQNITGSDNDGQTL